MPATASSGKAATVHVAISVLHDPMAMLLPGYPVTPVLLFTAAIHSQAISLPTSILTSIRWPSQTVPVDVCLIILVRFSHTAARACSEATVR